MKVRCKRCLKVVDIWHFTVIYDGRWGAGVWYVKGSCNRCVGIGARKSVAKKPKKYRKYMKFYMRKYRGSRLPHYAQ